MNFKSLGPRPVWFLVASALILGGLAGAELRDDVHWIDTARVAAVPDNDDNPDITGPARADDDDRPLTSSERARITAAATKAVGSGIVTDTEASDDFGTAYEAEVYTHAGAEWDIELDANFAVVSKSRDS